MCVSTYERGFSISNLMLQLGEIIVFVPLILFGLGYAGRYLLKKIEDDEAGFFVLMFGVMAVAAVLAQTVNLPGIVGAFLAGLAVNAAAQEKPAKEKLEFFGNSFFIPIFFAVTGFLIDPVVFVRSIIDNFALVAGIIGALLIGKGIAAEIASRAFKYTPAARMTIWSLTLPQVAATLAATLVGFNTFNPAGERLIDERILDAVFVLMLTTATLGPLMTQYFAPLMLESESSRSFEPEALSGTPGVIR
ncbi:MAG: cation:proton antiporter, partial [Acidobacteria bacterium]|nr:cation:proton antiporter [Acidobacteriota bacterium]